MLDKWFGSEWHGESNPLLLLSVILIAGLFGGWAARRLRIPSVTGNILAGVAIAPLFPGHEAVESLQPLSRFAMGLIAVSVGSHLSYRRIHNALRRIVLIAVAEVAGAVLLVGLMSWFLGADWLTCVVLGCIAAATAPATTVALIREMRAKGTFVKTLLTVVALDNMLCIMLFAFSSTVMSDYYAADGGRLVLSEALLHTAWQFGGSLALGAMLGMLTERLVHRPHVHDFSAVFVVILLSVGLSMYLDLNFLLTSLFFGVYLGNASEEAVRQTNALEPIEMLLLISFFTLAGASLHWDTVREAGLLCVGYLVARFAGKALGACVGGVVARSSRRIWANISLGLVPQAGVAIGLVVLLEGDADIPREVSGLIATLVLGAVTVNEIIGPFFTRRALAQAKEVNKDRRRIVEFLQEEYILTNLKAADKWEALRKMTDFFALTHSMPSNKKGELYASIEAREKDCSTAVGMGVAIPHGRIDEGSGVRGVLALCREGIEFEALDGAPVKIMMLVVTPHGYEREHLEVMASLVQIVSDPVIRERLVAAIDANDAWEVLEGEDTRNYNYFLDGEAAGGESRSASQS